MSLPILLRRLAQAVSDRDSRGTDEALGRLTAEGGWSSSLTEFIGRLSGNDASFIRSRLSPSPPAPTPGSFAAQGGGGTKVGSILYNTYPSTAAAMASAVGFGTWTAGAGYLCDEASGNLVPIYGSPALTVASTPLFGIAGPLGPTDKAIGFDSAADGWAASAFDVNGTSDLMILWVGQFSTTTPGTVGAIIGKWNVTPRWLVYVQANNTIQFAVTDGTHAASSTTAALPSGWHVGLAVLDRGANAARVITRTFTNTADLGAVGDATSVGSLANGNGFTVGVAGDATAPSLPLSISAFFVATGTGAAASMSTNLATAAANFAARVMP